MVFAATSLTHFQEYYSGCSIRRAILKALPVGRSEPVALDPDKVAAFISEVKDIAKFPQIATLTKLLIDIEDVTIDDEPLQEHLFRLRSTDPFFAALPEGGPRELRPFLEELLAGLEGEVGRKGEGRPCLTNRAVLEEALYKKMAQQLIERKCISMPIVIKDERLRVSYVKECLQLGRRISIAECGINDQEVLIEMALQEAGHDRSSIAYDIRSYGIQDQKALVAIAKKAAKTNPTKTGEQIRNFGLLEEKDRVAVALTIAEIECIGVSPSLPLFNIIDPAAQLAIALAEAQNKLARVSEHIKNYDCLDYESRLKVAKAVARTAPWKMAEHIALYELTNDDLLMLARFMAALSQSGISKYIKNFNITDPAIYQELAESLAVNDWSFAESVGHFHITDQARLSALAQTVARSWPAHLTTHITKFAIEDENIRAILALQIAPEVPHFPLYVRSFRLTDQKVLKALAEIALRNCPFMLVRGFVSYEFSDEAVRLYFARKLITINAPYFLSAEAGFGIKDESALGELQYLAKLYELRHGPVVEPGPVKQVLLDYALLRLKREEITDRTRQTLSWIIQYRNVSLVLALIDTFCEIRDKEAYFSLVTQAHLRLPMIFVAAWGAELPTFTAFLRDHRDVMRNGKTGTLQLVLQTLQVLEHYPLERRVALLEKYCTFPDLSLIQALCSSKRVPSHETSLTSQMIAILQETGVLDLEGVEDFAVRYTTHFSHSRVPNGLFTYVSHQSDLRLKPIMTAFVRSVLDESFPAIRYRPTNPHLEALSRHPDLYAAWQKAQPFVPVRQDEAKEIIVPSFEEFYKDQIAHNHMKKEGVDLLEGTDALALCQKLCKEELSLETLEELLDKLPDCEFKVHVAGLIKTLTTRLKTEVCLGETDNWEDLFLSGTEVEGSCQRIDGDPDLNKCLPAYVMDGKIRMIAIKNAQGKLVARALLKILWDPTKAEFVLFQERAYPTATPFAKTLKDFSLKRAAELNLPLFSEEGMGRAARLVSLGSPAPYEYEDACRTGITDGRYDIDVKQVLPS